MATASSQPAIGSVLREWRERRRLRPLGLAVDAGILARHLSLVGAGPSKPGRDLLPPSLGRPAVPFREQNRLLLAGGHAPAFPERSLEDPELLPVREALDQILAGHEPYPAFVVDRAWNYVAANEAMRRLTAGVAVEPALLEPPGNGLRLSFPPDGDAPPFVNPARRRAHFCPPLARRGAGGP